MWLYLPSWSLLSFFSARYKCISNETKLNPKKRGRTRKLVWLDTQQPALKSQPDLCESVLSLFHLCKTSQFLYSDSTWVPLWVGTSCRAQTPVEPQYEVTCVLKLERRMAYKTSLAQVSASGRLWEYHEKLLFLFPVILMPPDWDPPPGTGQPGVYTLGTKPHARLGIFSSNNAKELFAA